MVQLSPVAQGGIGTVAKAIGVARDLVRLAADEPEPDHLTHMRLQKLLYYVQGWSLAIRNGPLCELSTNDSNYALAHELWEASAAAEASLG